MRFHKSSVYTLLYLSYFHLLFSGMSVSAMESLFEDKKNIKGASQKRSPSALEVLDSFSCSSKRKHFKSEKKESSLFPDQKCSHLKRKFSGSSPISKKKRFSENLPFLKEREVKLDLMESELSIRQLRKQDRFLTTRKNAEIFDEFKLWKKQLGFTGQHSIQARRGSEGSLPDSIETISSASSEYHSEEIAHLAPKPTIVKKNTSKRTPRHSLAFKKLTGTKKGGEYAYQKNEKFTKPQIAHVQAHLNHGPDADTREHNLAVGEQAGNLKMNIADSLYKNGQVDGGTILVKKGTLIGVAAQQRLMNRAHTNLPITPSIITDLRQTSFDGQATEKQKKQVKRALDPFRVKEIKNAQNFCASSFADAEKRNRQVKKRIAKDIKNGTYTGLATYKFPDQSRSKRLNPYRDIPEGKLKSELASIKSGIKKLKTNQPKNEMLKVKLDLMEIEMAIRKVRKQDPFLTFPTKQSK